MQKPPYAIYKIGRPKSRFAYVPSCMNLRQGC